MVKKIAIGCDHAGVSYKEALKKLFAKKNIEFIDFGTNTDASVDYPVYADMVSKAVQSGECDLGFLICGTGIGMSMAANKHKGIRAALCTNTFSAHATREHNNANVCCMGARVITKRMAVFIADAFISTEFSAEERHIRRVNMVNEFDNKD